MPTLPPPPTPHQSPLPPTMRVAVELGYVHGCPDCLRVLESTSAAAFRDKQVTRFIGVPGRKHAHEVTEGAGALPGLNPPAPAPATLPASDTNGSEPADVERALFSTHQTAGESDLG